MSKILLVGPPNAGKTTLYNLLTSSKEKTGNFHGVTATVASGDFTYKNKTFTICDLPGIYSLTPYSLEEKNAVRELKGDCECVICLIEAIYPLAGLRLINELKPLNKPIIAVITKSKLHNKRGGRFDLETFKTLSGVSAVKSEDLKGLKELILNAKFSNIKNFDTSELLSKIYTPSKRGKMDKILLNPLFCIFYSVALFSLVIFAVFSAVSPISKLSVALQNGFSKLSLIFSERLIEFGITDFVVTVCARALEATGALLGFIPQLVALNFFMLVVEDSGIAERYSFILGRYLKVLGLSGKSIFPLVSCLGCTALSCKLTNNAENKEVKNRTLNCMPFLPCSAKNAVLIFLCVKIFPHPEMVLIATYCFCVALLVLNAKICQRINPISVGEGIVELAPFAFPSLKKILKSSLDCLTSFIKKISFSVIAVGVIIGVLTSVTLDFNYTADLQSSMLCHFGKKIAVALKPIGLGDWKIVVSLISGLFAKETTLGTLEILYGDNFYLTTAQGVSFLVFFTLYPPCLVAISAIVEQNKKMGLLLAVKHLILGYIGALFAYIVLTKGVLFSIIMLSIIFGCVIFYEIIYSRRKRKTFTHCGKRGCGVFSLSQTSTQKGYKDKRQKNG